MPSFSSTLAIFLLSLGCLLSINPALAKPADGDDEEEEEDDDGEEDEDDHDESETNSGRLLFFLSSYAPKYFCCPFTDLFNIVQCLMMFNAMLNYISVEGACPDEWTSIAGGCYQFLPEKYSWEDAKEACHMLHGWLVEIESEEQNDAIHDEAKKQDGWKTAWIGLTDTAEEGEWVWSSGKATDFTNWAPDQPSNTKQQRNKMQGEDCAMMNIDHGAAKCVSLKSRGWEISYIHQKKAL